MQSRNSLKLNFRERENVVVRLFITKKKLIKKFAEELAYLQIRADWWFYVAELRCICNDLGILNEVYDEAYKIYDFRNSGKKNHVADIELIKRLDREFCEPRKKKRLLFQT